VAAPPRSVEIGYEIAHNGSALAEVTQRLEHDGRSYRISETWKGKGIYAMRGEAVRSSQGAIVADGLRPQKFEDKRPGRDARHADFDPAAKTPPRDTVTAGVADGKRVTSYTYKVAGRERVQTPAGEFNALKLVKHKDNPQDKATEIWLAVDRQFMPVRILVVDKDGTRVDQVAARIAVK
jgi:hypothetical protein